MTTASLPLFGLLPLLILMVGGAVVAAVRLAARRGARRGGVWPSRVGRGAGGSGAWSTIVSPAHRRRPGRRSRHRRARGTAGARHAWAGGSPAGEQPAYRAVEVEELWLTTPRHRNVRAAKEPDKYAARYLEERVAVRRRERERDEVTTWGGPRPDPDIADPRWLVQPADQQVPGERPTDRLTPR